MCSILCSIVHCISTSWIMNECVIILLWLHWTRKTLTTNSQCLETQTWCWHESRWRMTWMMWRSPHPLPPQDNLQLLHQGKEMRRNIKIVSTCFLLRAQSRLSARSRPVTGSSAAGSRPATSLSVKDAVLASRPASSLSNKVWMKTVLINFPIWFVKE